MTANKKQKSAVYDVLAFIFDGKDDADEAVKEIKESGVLGGEAIIAEVVIQEDSNGKIHIHEPGRGGLGAGIGVVAGGLLGLIGGPAGLLAWAVAGGVVGGVAGKYLGRPFSKGDLQEITAAMPPDSSALLLLVEDKNSEEVIDSMRGYNTNVVTLTVGDELSEQITTYIGGEGTEEGKGV